VIRYGTTGHGGPKHANKIANLFLFSKIYFVDRLNPLVRQYLERQHLANLQPNKYNTDINEDIAKIGILRD